VHEGAGIELVEVIFISHIIDYVLLRGYIAVSCSKCGVAAQRKSRSVEIRLASLLIARYVRRSVLAVASSKYLDFVKLTTFKFISAA
jgi:hypothetical protein